MKQFIAFYNSDFDATVQAQMYADEASVHAKAIGKQLASTILDVTGNELSKKFWDQSNTIECVTIDGDTKRETNLNPGTLSDIDGMIDRL
jgi:hypothetical protein